MKKVSILWSMVLLITLMSCSNNEIEEDTPDPDPETNSNIISKYDLKVYDETGSLDYEASAAFNYRDDGYIKSINVTPIDPEFSGDTWEYNAEGQLIKYESYEQIAEFTYNNDGQIIREKTVQSTRVGSAQTPYYYSFEYNSNGQLIKKVSEENSNTYSSYEYDATGNLIKINNFYEGEVDDSYGHIIFKYTDKENKIKALFPKAFKAIYFQEEVNGAQGTMDRFDRSLYIAKAYNEEGDYDESKTYTYEYDDDGLPTKYVIELDDDFGTERMEIVVTYQQ